MLELQESLQLSEKWVFLTFCTQSGSMMIYVFGSAVGPCKVHSLNVELLHSTIFALHPDCFHVSLIIHKF